MRMRFIAALLALSLGGCETAPNDPTVGDTLVTVVGTPVFIALKIPVCLASVVIAVPIAGVSGLVPNDGAKETQRDLGTGLAQNCGPPYVLTP